MAGKPSRRNRRGNVVIPFDLREFLCRLAEATGGPSDREFDWSVLKPGSIGKGCGDTPDRFAVTYLFEEILSKFDDGLPSPEKERATWERFSAAEEACLRTNERLLHDKTGYSVSSQSVWSQINEARRKISRVLGDFDWNEAAHGFSFGPGATTRLPRRRADRAYKYSGTPETTPGNLALAYAAISSIPLWKESLLSQGGAVPKVRDGNKIITVPKNFKTNRVIAVEPDMNMYVQKGIGTMIRKRLKRVGVDLDDQRVNQNFAQLGVRANLATIDLSMASDTVSYEIVRQLLPSDWFEALEQCRSPVGFLPSGERVVYRKFSSMGNGYTFELESLIFWALCQACASAHSVDATSISVYGDDIIFPAERYHELKELLEFVGFLVNDKKSFASGPFRESCGKHYFNGFDVTPFYVRRPISKLTDLFVLHNNLYRWVGRNWWNEQINRDKLRDICTWVRSFAPMSWRKPAIPDGFGDGAFLGTFEEATPQSVATRKSSRGWEGFRCKSIISLTTVGDFDDIGRLISSLHWAEQTNRIPFREPLGGVSLAPRERWSYIIVPQFTGADPFASFSSN